MYKLIVMELLWEKKTGIWCLIFSNNCLFKPYHALSTAIRWPKSTNLSSHRNFDPLLNRVASLFTMTVVVESSWKAVALVAVLLAVRRRSFGAVLLRHQLLVLLYHRGAVPGDVLAVLFNFLFADLDVIRLLAFLDLSYNSFWNLEWWKLKF